MVMFPFVLLWLEFELHVVAADVPVLLSIDDMDRLEVLFNKLKNLLIHPRSNEDAAI